MGILSNRLASSVIDMNAFTTTHKHAARGFTLVEMIVVIAINTIILLSFTLALDTFYTNNSYTFAQSNEVDQARQSSQAWVRDFREATTAEDGTFPIGVAEPNRLVFYSNVDPATDVDLVEYRISSTTLEKRVFHSTGFPPSYSTTSPDRVEILSTAVRNLSNGLPMFRYYNNAGSEITNPATMVGDIRYVEMQLDINVDPNRVPTGFLLTNSVAPRNLKDNL